MLETVRAADVTTLWQLALTELLGGEAVSPRGQRTFEARAAKLILDDPRQRWVSFKGRKLVPALGVLEGLLLLTGQSRPDLLKRIAPQYAKFVDPATGELDGAYGPRVARQLPYIRRLLEQDPDSRQAVVTIYGPEDHRTSLDVPCTVSLQFFIRGGLLELVVYMRSNDIWLGLPYDIVQFTLLQEALAADLGIGLGTYTHVDGSLHLYERNLEQATKVLRDPVIVPVVNPPMSAPRPLEVTQTEAVGVLSEWERHLDGCGIHTWRGTPFFNWAFDKLAEAAP